MESAKCQKLNCMEGTTIKQIRQRIERKKNPKHSSIQTKSGRKKVSSHESISHSLQMYVHSFPFKRMCIPPFK